MVTQQYNLSLEPELIERYHKLIPKGDRTNDIRILIIKRCDELEALQIGTKAKKIWFDKKIKPFILKFAGDRDLFSLIENEELKEAFRESKIVISAADIKLCIERLIVEGEDRTLIYD